MALPLQRPHDGDLVLRLRPRVHVGHAGDRVQLALQLLHAAARIGRLFQVVFGLELLHGVANLADPLAVHGVRRRRAAVLLGRVGRQDADRLGNGLGRLHVVAGDHHHAHARVVRAADRVGHLGARRVLRGHEAGKHQLALLDLGVGPLRHRVLEGLRAE